MQGKTPDSPLGVIRLQQIKIGFPFISNHLSAGEATDGYDHGEVIEMSIVDVDDDGDGKINRTDKISVAHTHTTYNYFLCLAINATLTEYLRNLAKIVLPAARFHLPCAPQPVLHFIRIITIDT